MLEFLKNIFKEEKHDETKVSNWSYQRFCSFLGYTVYNDPDFNKKIEIIEEQVNTYKEENINTIAKKANCKINECILKLKYLKNKKIIDNYYYINGITKEIKKCSDDDIKLLNKYHDLIYLNHYQIEEMQYKLKKNNESITKDEIIKELRYLYDKSLLNGIKINDDNVIVYYTLEKKKKAEYCSTIQCPNCGALVDVPIKSSENCNYCGTIVKDTYIRGNENV